MNLSVSGHSSQEVLARIEAEILARKNSEAILTILAIGVNDSYEKNGQRRTAEPKFTQNVDKILKIAQEHGRVLIVGCSACVNARVQPTAWDPALQYSNDRLREYEHLLEDCAKRSGSEFVPLWKATNEAQSSQETLPDGIHPNNAGHKVIHGLIAPKLEELLA
jgi:lysophospholipase L1-like esterase